MEVRNMRQLWDFVEGDLINGIYWDKLYNKGYRYGIVKKSTMEVEVKVGYPTFTRLSFKT